MVVALSSTGHNLSTTAAAALTQSLSLSLPALCIAAVVAVEAANPADGRDPLSVARSSTWGHV